MTNKHLAQVLEFADTTVRPQDDLYRAVNGAWLDSTVIPDDLPGYGTFVELRLQSEKNVRDIVDELAVKASNDSDAKLVSDLYSSWMDIETANAKGTAPLAPELALIDEAHSHGELARNLGTLMRAGVATFFGVDIDTDLNNPDRYITFFGQAGLGLPDEAYYHDEQYAPILAAYREFMPKMFQLVYSLSDEEARKQAEYTFALESKLADVHMSAIDSRDTDKINNLMPFADFVARTPHIQWGAILAQAGFPMDKITDVIVLHPDTLTASAQLWHDTPLEELKAYQRWRLANARSPYLTQEIDEAFFEFYGKVLSGTPVQRERWKRGVSLINSSLGEVVGKLYVERHFPPAHKQAMLTLVDDLLEAYRRSISNLEWMSDETKARALEKIDSFNVKIGYPDTWRDYSALVTGVDLVENIRAVNAYEFDYELAKLGTEVNRNEWLMNPQTVNAYYNPVWNEIVFPAAILQFPFFDSERDAALNYGGIGAVIGHEIGHGFDDQGSKYDARGVINNWWTDSDRSAFEERTRALISQYDAYVPAQFTPDDTHHVQGALTIGENIGDLGGLSIGLKAYAIALEREGLTFENAPVIDGVNAVQRLMYSYARVWQELRRDEYMQMMLAVDPHSPAEFRCNGVVKNVDAFAEAFDVREGDGLYLPPEERVSIW